MLNVFGNSVAAHAKLTSDTGFTNSGAITMESVIAGYNSTLEISSGTLTNAASGVLNFNAGTGGARYLYSNLANSGTVNINKDTTFFKTSGSYVNNNLLNIATGATLTISGSNQTFTQAGGTLDIDGTLALSSMDFAYTGGTILGVPVLNNIDLTIGAGTGPAEFLIGGASTLVGDVLAVRC